MSNWSLSVNSRAGDLTREKLEAGILGVVDSAEDAEKLLGKWLETILATAALCHPDATIVVQVFGEHFVRRPDRAAAHSISVTLHSSLNFSPKVEPPPDLVPTPEEASKAAAEVSAEKPA